MRQYTTPEQTAKLIELGVEKPRVAMPKFEWKYGEPQFHYTIGELIEMLPRAIGDDYLDISSPFGEDDGWMITYGQQVYDDWEDLYTFTNEELIDALYDMIVKLKEEGVI